MPHLPPIPRPVVPGTIHADKTSYLRLRARNGFLIQAPGCEDGRFASCPSTSVGDFSAERGFAVTQRSPPRSKRSLELDPIPYVV